MPLIVFAPDVNALLAAASVKYNVPKTRLVVAALRALSDLPEDKRNALLVDALLSQPRGGRPPLPGERMANEETKKYFVAKGWKEVPGHPMRLIRPEGWDPEMQRVLPPRPTPKKTV